MPEQENSQPESEVSKTTEENILLRDFFRAKKEGSNDQALAGLKEKLQKSTPAELQSMRSAWKTTAEEFDSEEAREKYDTINHLIQILDAVLKEQEDFARLKREKIQNNRLKSLGKNLKRVLEKHEELSVIVDNEELLFEKIIASQSQPVRNPLLYYVENLRFYIDLKKETKEKVTDELSDTMVTYLNRAVIDLGAYDNFTEGAGAKLWNNLKQFRSDPEVRALETEMVHKLKAASEDKMPKETLNPFEAKN